MAEPIPVFEDLTPVYGSEGTPAAQERYARIIEAFERRFGAKPELFARSPGRVNLIGEHIDYEGYGVLPMAIRQDTVVAIRKGGNDLVIGNLNKHKYPDVTLSVDPSKPVDVANHSWANYFHAAYKGVFDYLRSKGLAAPQPVGLQVLVEGQVPTGSGLSSSSALTCTCALALLGVFGITAQQADVAEFTCTCERHVGTESGGMDQAISIMGMPGLAKMVEFNPVRASDVSLPEGATFVISNSLTVSNKAETAPLRYNMRVVECRLAAICLAISLGHPKEQAVQIKTLREVEPIIEAKFAGPKGSVSNSSAAAVEQYLHEGPYPQEEIESLLGTPLATLFSDNASAKRVIPLAAGAGGFKLRNRARHVYAEAARVLQFRDVCNSSQIGAEDKLGKLGALMDESQASCRDLYECSCEELDTLVGVSKAAGALGSRLTGAGWGGCTVSLVREAAAAEFINQVKSEYFSGCIKDGKVSEELLAECIFASRPASGGAIIKLKL
ncbi:hypothetical protein WJX72_004871 [[Myrmecia] bisecta]|uniref:Galactokinase n=1 Tax=[Myrmecia] bisecta TaxID=41462 RepID=A0AAW1Q743_9CHLO